MNIRLLSIIGALVVLWLGGCVVADHDTEGYYGGYGYYDPWFYDGYVYPAVPGYFAPYPYYEHRHTYFYDKGRGGYRDHWWSGNQGGNSTGSTGSGGSIVEAPRVRHENNWQKPMRSEHYGIHHDRGHDRGEGRHGQFAKPPHLRCHGPRC